MVLTLNGRPVEFNQSELRALLYDKYCSTEANKFHKKSIQIIESNQNLIYLHQREMAIINVLNNPVCFLGTDDATTCQFVVLDCQNAGLVGAAHLDGCGTEIFFQTFVNRVRKAIESFFHLKNLTSRKNLPESEQSDQSSIESMGKSQFEIEVSICGGFIDDNRLSEELSKDILTILANNDDFGDLNFRLNVCSIVDLNNCIKKGHNFPIQYGFLYNCRIHALFPASFSQNAKEPMAQLRSTRFCCEQTLFNVFNTEENILEIKDFDYKGYKNRIYYQSLSQSTNEVLRKYSTSPLQEREGYVEHLRSTFKLMYEHPEPRLSLYDTEGGGVRFKCDSNSGDWMRIKPKS